MQKVLVVQLNRMGDLIQTLPILQSWKQDLQKRQVTLVCLTEFRDVVESQALFDRLISLEWQDVRKLCDESNRKVFWSLRPFCEMLELAEQYDHVINLTHDDASAALCGMIKGVRKSGRIRTESNESRLLGDWSKYLVASVKNRTQNLFNLVDIHMGIAGVRHEAIQNYFRLADGAVSEALELLRKHGLRRDGKLVALQMGASQRNRAWPLENFATLANRLQETVPAEFVLLGNEEERELGNKFAELVKRPAIDLIGLTKIYQIPALLKCCDLLISNDTGTIHFAASIGTPTVGLYFSTAYFGETAPYGEGQVVLQTEIESESSTPPKAFQDSRGAEFLPVESVLAAVRTQLGTEGNAASEILVVSTWRSKFLCNGTLIYAPVGKTAVSTSYFASLLNRLMWEKVFGLETDFPFVDEMISRCADVAALKKILMEHVELLSRANRKFSEGIKLSRQMSAISWPVPGSAEQFRTINDRVIQTTKDVAGLSKRIGLLTDFFLLEMMEIDSLPGPELGRELEFKFEKFEKITAKFLATLEMFRSRLIPQATVNVALDLDRGQNAERP